MDFFTDADLVIKFLFKPVNGGLNLGTCNSVGRLEFKQDGSSRTDERPHHFGIIHERCLPRMKDDPGCNQPGNDDPKGEVIFQFRLIGKQNQAGIIISNGCKIPLQQLWQLTCQTANVM
jgi:hypothetical protein